jgi:hypothetical protein
MTAPRAARAGEHRPSPAARSGLRCAPRGARNRTACQIGEPSDGMPPLKTLTFLVVGLLPLPQFQSLVRFQCMPR